MLAFNTEEDRGDHYGVFEQSYAGSCFLRLRKDQIDLDKGYVRGVPVVEKSTYKNPRIFFSDSNISVMHGSKRGIQASHGNRVSEYEYHFSYWLGKRFGKYVKKTNKKILVIKTTKEASCHHRRYQDICNDEFQRGFNDAFGNYCLKGIISQGSAVKSNYKGNDATWDKALVYSDLYLYCHEEGMTFEDISPIHEMIRSMKSIDVIEKQKQLI
tara:strand:- start:1 stop:639 length:639 start_codon:yes stop_codon:yes gene_type:complete